MTPEQQKQYEEMKLEQYLSWAKTQPSLLARILGSLKKGVVEKSSLKKQASGRINAQNARDARKAKAELDSKNTSTGSG